MKKSLLVFGLSLAFVLFLSTGCKSDAPDDGTSAVPEAVDDPTGFGGFGQQGSGVNQTGLESTGAGEWKDTTSDIGSVDANGWRPADPSGNRLGMPIIYFAYDSDVLVPSETANLDKIAEYMADKPKLGLVIEGHCDQRGTDEYNRSLGERRANVVRAYLAKKGVADSKINTMSFGKDKPAVEGSGEDIWRQNRRAVPVPMLIP
ncbi:MAG: OmpA family protein [Victivallaceae bacterium]|nr:OmpA family protein [Victivallaceae bacterium]